MAELTWQPTGLPVEDSLGQVAAAVTSQATCQALVLTAEPGAGKSSLVPLAIANALSDASRHRVLLLEPRRLAARATANRLAQLTGTELGGVIGLTIRGQRSVSATTRVEVVTEAVLTNRIQADAELPGTGSIVFDEFHERNLHSDLGLAMALEVRDSLRPDLSLTVMSATLDAGPITSLLNAPPPLAIPGRTYPVEIIHLQRPAHAGFAKAVASATAKALRVVAGDVLVFVPGRWEIDRTIAEIRRLNPSELATCELLGLHGGTPKAQQLHILAPSRTRRIIVSTAIAETSVTVPGVEAVVDGGLLRRANYDPLSGLGQLETRFATRFAADQRAGRAGRVRPGTCFRLWSKEDDRLLDLAVPPAIVDGDPLPVAFELARWGDPFATSLPLLDHPGEARLRAGIDQLLSLGLTTETGTLTKMGKQAGALPLHPRSASLVLHNPNNEVAITAAACLDSNTHFRTADLQRVVDQARQDSDIQRSRKRIKQALSRRAGRTTSNETERPLDELMATAWPDRVGMARPGRAGRFLMASGREVEVPPGDPLHGAPFVVVAEADGAQRSAKLRLGVATNRSAILDACSDHIEWTDEVGFDERSERLKAERVQRLGAIVLHRTSAPFPKGAQLQAALLAGVRRRGLDLFHWSKSAKSVRIRLAWLHEQDPTNWPGVDDASLLASLDEWLPLGNVRSPAQLRSIDMGGALLNRLDWQQRGKFEDLAPTSLDLPSGGSSPVRYSTGRPVWSVRLQRLLGLDTHPCIGPNQIPITIELLSPANRPAQTTTDLPGFWRGSYQQVRTDLRGRYPKHAWPQDPLTYERE